MARVKPFSLLLRMFIVPSVLVAMWVCTRSVEGAVTVSYSTSAYDNDAGMGAMEHYEHVCVSGFPSPDEDSAGNVSLLGGMGVSGIINSF